MTTFDPQAFRDRLAADTRKARRAEFARHVGLVALGLGTAAATFLVVRRPAAVLAAATVAAPVALPLAAAAVGTPCRDGWTSPSLRGQGTCSHHRGIK